MAQSSLERVHGVSESRCTCHVSCRVTSHWTLQGLFAKASQLTGEEFLGRLDYYANAWLPARDLVLDGLSSRQNIDASGKIIIFEQFAPWKVILVSIKPFHWILTHLAGTFV
jgi:hypothetical protein